MNIKDFRDDMFMPRIWLDLVIHGSTIIDADAICVAYAKRFREEGKEVITSEIIKQQIEDAQLEAMGGMPDPDTNTIN